MSRTLTAMFDSRADAEAARDRLKDASIDISNVNIHDQSSGGYSSDQYSSHQNRGFWDSVKDVFLPDEDRHTYEEGVRRGGAVLTAQVDEDDADDAVRILDEANSVDLDNRTADWRSSGWDYQNTSPTEDYAGTGALGLAGGTAAGDYASGASTGTTGTTGTMRTGSDVNEERIPIVEEQLRVGKREVNRGGVRVRSYVVETPVHEQVSLREENVSVERVPVDQPVGAMGDAFRERSFEVTETGEEAVVAKEARVREELVVHKNVNGRVEQVDDTVRHTEVDVENLGTDQRGMTTTGTTGTTTGTTGTDGLSGSVTPTDGTRDRY